MPQPFIALPQEPVLDSRILIVDDSEMNCVMLRQIFENHKFTNIACASNGVQAMEILPSYKPQLILLDLMMPYMSGYEFCKQLRNNGEYANVPILAQTALETQEDHNEIFRLGASDLVTKPINDFELIARARIHLERFHLIARLQQYQARIAGELGLARQMQNDLMPSAASMQECQRVYHIDIAEHFETPSEMGGDMWGFKPLYEHQLSVFMSDFSGHGVHAALNAFRLHTLMQEMSEFYGENAGSYLNALNERLRSLLGKGQFATMFYGIIDTHKSLLYYATAATPHPLLLRGATGKIERLDGSGYPLAMEKHNTPYETNTAIFDVGDILILYSDALVETLCKDGTFIDVQTLMAYIEDIWSSTINRTAQTIRDAIIDYFKAFAITPLQDDLTVSIYHRR
jgi:sigma-B regulation protein RsbU (phosphoserine phosphatase)